ncbi:MAG: hypothetical protein OES26_16890 [Gammaproteobacteria bacterium]|nr:hypothetical protein [Gammaproteobacteria bacterium]
MNETHSHSTVQGFFGLGEEQSHKTEFSVEAEVSPPHRFASTAVDDAPALGINLTNGEINTINWATGYYPDYSWLHVPMLDRQGKIRHAGGVVESPGMYLLGMTFLRRRKSSFIHGAGDHARDLSAHLVSYLRNRSSAPYR